MKKVLSILLVILILTLTACTGEGGESYPITVNGTPIDSEIFAY